MEPRVARHGRDRYPQPAYELRIVGRACLDRLGMRAAQNAQAKGLRRLDARQNAAIDDIAGFFVRLFDERIGHGQCRDRGVGGLQGGEQAADDVLTYAWPRGVMDEYERPVFPFIERGECVADLLLPFRDGIGGNPVLRQRADRRHDVIDREGAARQRRQPGKAAP